MYVTDGWGSVYKLDLTQGPGKDVRWIRAPTRTGRVRSPAAASTTAASRYGGTRSSRTLDGRLLATDKETGEVAWERQAADPAIAEVITWRPWWLRTWRSPASRRGVRHPRLDRRTDLNTGKEVWRRHTIPGPGEPGHDTWADNHDAWKTGGGSTWVTGSYDPDEPDLWGRQSGPDWDAEYRPGDNLYTNSMIAVSPENGEIKWYYQYTPNDPYDYDGVAENILVDAEVDGAPKSSPCTPIATASPTPSTGPTASSSGAPSSSRS